MKQPSKKIMFLIALVYTLLSKMTYSKNYSSGAQPRASMPYVSIRSQGTDAAREMVGVQKHINLCEQKKNYGIVAITTDYSQTFKTRGLKIFN